MRALLLGSTLGFSGELPHTSLFDIPCSIFDIHKGFHRLAALIHWLIAD
jgi:hypothetical protein